MAVTFWEGDGKYLVACAVIAAAMAMLPVRMSNFLSIIPTVIGALILFFNLRNAEKEFDVLVSIGIGSFVMFLGLAIMVVAAVLLGVKKK